MKYNFGYALSVILALVLFNVFIVMSKMDDRIYELKADNEVVREDADFCLDVVNIKVLECVGDDLIDEMDLLHNDIDKLSQDEFNMRMIDVHDKLIFVEDKLNELKYKFENEF